MAASGTYTKVNPLLLRIGNIVTVIDVTPLDEEFLMRDFYECILWSIDSNGGCFL